MFARVAPAQPGCVFTMHRMLSLAALALAVAALVETLPASPAIADERKSTEVVGGWVGALPCPFIAGKPSASYPTVVPFECVSGSTWDGTWVGHTVYRATGSVDLLTGDLHGTVDETFVGVPGPSGAPGTLRFLGTVDADGATGSVVLRERIVAGTGGFAGSSGDVLFHGAHVGPLVAHGGYHGTWTHT